MKNTTLYRAKISALGSHFPEKVVTNADMEKLVDTTDEWIRERSGIHERHMLRDGEKNSDMAVQAAKKAIKGAGIEAKDIDLILSCSNTPDKFLPAMGCIIQNKLGISGCPAFDILAACAGWVVGVSVAEQFIQTGKYKHVLVTGSEAMSRFMNWKDRSTCVLFGDGAGAAIISRSEPGEKSEILSTHVHSMGEYGDILDLPGVGSDMPCSEEVIKNDLHYFRMKGQEVFKHAVRSMMESSLEALEKNKLSTTDIDWIVPHQANIRIIDAVAKKLHIPPEKVLLNVHKYGNTSAATIPSCLDEFVDNGKIKRGDTILLTTFGGGLTYASAIFRW